MSVHPFIRSEQRGQGHSADPMREFSEQFWETEPDRSRPSPWWVGVVALALVGVAFVAGCIVGWGL